MSTLSLFRSNFSIRAGAILFALCFSICAALLLNFSLEFFIGNDLISTDPAQRADPAQLNRIQQRINKIAAQRGSTNLKPTDLAVVVGLSTAREGIDPIAFEKLVGSDVRLLNLAASGGSMSELRAYTAPLIQSKLRPSVVYVMVHPSWLAGRASKQDILLKREHLNSPSLITQFRNYRAWFIEQIWLIRNRALIQAKINEAFLQARLFVGGLFFMSDKAVALQDALDPWAVQLNYDADHATQDFLMKQLSQWRAMNWFQESALLDNSREALQLRAALIELFSVSDNVILVMMPEASSFRSLVPPVGEESLVSIARLADTRVQIWNFRQFLSEEKFHDLAHPNRLGRHALTEKIAAESKALLNK